MTWLAISIRPDHHVSGAKGLRVLLLLLLLLQLLLLQLLLLLLLR